MCFIFSHHEERLTGLLHQLSLTSNEIKVVKTEETNKLKLIKYGEVVYESKITAFDYGGDGVLDCSVQAALAAVK